MADRSPRFQTGRNEPANDRAVILLESHKTPPVPSACPGARLAPALPDRRPVEHDTFRLPGRHDGQPPKLTAAHLVLLRASQVVAHDRETVTRTACEWPSTLGLYRWA